MDSASLLKTTTLKDPAMARPSALAVLRDQVLKSDCRPARPSRYWLTASIPWDLMLSASSPADSGMNWSNRLSVGYVTFDITRSARSASRWAPASTMDWAVLFSTPTTSATLTLFLADVLGSCFLV